MRLRVRQHRALATMERQLRASDPRLMGMFAVFAWLNRDEAADRPEAMPHRHHHRRHRSRLWPYALLSSLAVALVGLTVALSSPTSPSCALSGYLSPGRSANSAPRACRPAPRHATIPRFGGR